MSETIQIETHYLYPGALFASTIPHNVTTVLGSCVSVCLHDPFLKIGGINHIMLPLWNGKGLASPKYGNIAMEKLLEKMLSLGSAKNRIQAKVFGGGEVIGNDDSLFRIGERNIEIAFELLEQYKIQVVGKSVGGKFGRKIIFNTQTSAVMHKFLERNDLS
ncbi:MAG: chemotaxis protein CheD [Bacteroidota bacterium]